VTGYDEPGVGYDEPGVGYDGDTRAVRATAWDPTYSTEVAALVRSGRRRWLHEVDNVGSANFDLQREDPDVAALPDRTIVRFTVDATTRFAARIGPWDQQTIAPGEEPAEIRAWTLKGLTSILAEGLVYPENGLGAIIPDPDHRYWNWASGLYDDSAWGTATVVKALLDYADDPYPSSPQNLPGQLLPVVKWIWAQAEEVGPPPQPVGDCLFRTTFNLPAQASLRLYISADDGFTPFFDGVRYAGDTRAFLWGEDVKYVNLGLVAAGTHTLAVIGTNIERDLASTNIAAVMFAVVEMTNGGATVGTIRAQSDENTKVMAYPSPFPGMTPGRILRLAIEEAQARGALDGVTLSFTDTLDSDGNAWSEVDLSTPVPQTNVLALARMLPVDIDMGPDDLTLHAWARPRGADLSASVTLARAVNLQGLRHRFEPADMTVGVARYADGRLRERVQPGAAARVENYLEVSTAPSAGAVDDLIDAEFTRHADGVLEATSTVVPVTGAVPYVDFTVGDIISEPDPDLAASDRRVWSIAVSEDENGFPIYEVGT
jgi:hypothetical protein